MAIDLSSLSDSLSKIGEAFGVDRVTAGAGVLVAVLLLLMLLRLAFRRKAPSEQRPTGAEDAAVRTSTSRPRTQRAGSAIDDRIAALRVQTEDLEANAPARRHFSGVERRSTHQYQLRRR
jgi:hypothetical protein